MGRKFRQETAKQTPYHFAHLVLGIPSPCKQPLLSRAVRFRQVVQDCARIAGDQTTASHGDRPIIPLES
jgi:hypothetical protein